MRTQNILTKLRHGAAQLRITHYALCIGLALTTSCADMLEQNDDLSMTPEQNRLSTPNDTIYSVIGTINLMQRVADRVNLLGEVRADLVQCTPDASIYLQNLARYDFDNLGQYNRVADYYAIINNCNYFINTVDTTLAKRGQSIFKREYVVMKTYRAWAYLQLAVNYGEVPFYTHFLATEAEGQAVMQEPKRDVDYICNYFIDDLLPFMETPYPQYGAIGSWECSSFFIPVRVMLGELCLWAGRYQEAAQYYHDFITHPDKQWPLSTLQVAWHVRGKGDLSGIASSYSSSYSTSGESIALIPMEETEADGTITRLDDIYSSTEDNNYYYQLTRSEELTALSARQNYCYTWDDATQNTHDTIVVHQGDTVFDDRRLYGDLRLYDAVDEGYTMSSTTSAYNRSFQTVNKISTKAQSLYTTPQIYLHYAEAMNRAGYPSAAMMVLKYGVCPEYIAKYVNTTERGRAGSLLTFSPAYFPRESALGIHSRGCGQADADTSYVLPMPDVQLATIDDTIQYQIPIVEDMIMDEAALECCFEGTRFGDLVRISRRRSDPSYLADRVSRRRGATDAALRARLLTPANWYLPLK